MPLVGYAGTMSDKPDFDAGAAAYRRRDFPTAIEHWQPLADQGDAAAQFWIGMLHETGSGFPRNFAEGARWWRKAALQGYPDALHNYGLMYFKGEGVTPDYAEAYFWLSLAVSAGVRPAPHFADEAASKLTAAERANADKLVKAWRPVSGSAPDPAPDTLKRKMSKLLTAILGCIVGLLILTVYFAYFGSDVFTVTLFRILFHFLL